MEGIAQEANLTAAISAIFCLCKVGGLGESAGGKGSHAERSPQSQQMDYRWWEGSIVAQRTDLRGTTSESVSKGSGGISPHEALQ